MVWNYGRFFTRPKNSRKLAEPGCGILEKDDPFYKEAVMSDKHVGKVTHYFGRIGVAVLELKDTLRVGDTVHFLGHSTDFRQKVNSLQIEHQNVSEAKPGQDVALKVDQKVHPNDEVFRTTEEE
jgi:translation initiation factor IF-2